MRTLVTALGQSISADFFGCDRVLLNDVTAIETLMVTAARAANATVISVAFHHFSPFGVSGVVVIQESHVAIHTWPEFAFASVDVFTCGTQMNPHAIVAHLQQSLGALQAKITSTPRGASLDSTAEAPKTVSLDARQITPKYTRDVWLTERQTNVAISLRHQGVPLFRARSEVQKIEVYDTHAFGRALLLDETIVCTEGDERAYHELLVHPALCVLASNSVEAIPIRAIVLGGGDGAIAREIAAHSSVESITVVEIDPLVVRAVQQTMPSMARGLSDPRVTLVYDDAFAFVRSQLLSAPRRWDLIVVDAIQPTSAAETESYQALKELCAPGAVLIVPGGLLRADAPKVRATHNVLCAVFGEAVVHPFCVHVPTMATGTWVGFWVSTRHPTQGMDLELINRFSDTAKLACYTAEAHVAAFALPPWVKALLNAGA